MVNKRDSRSSVASNIDDEALLGQQQMHPWDIKMQGINKKRKPPEIKTTFYFWILFFSSARKTAIRNVGHTSL